MQATRLLLVAALSTAGFAAHADEADASQYVHSFNGGQTRAEVRAQFDAGRTAANPWSTQYNPLAQFRSDRTRAQVQADYIANRDAVAAFTSEDSGSAFLAANQPAGTNRFAGQPALGE